MNSEPTGDGGMPPTSGWDASEQFNTEGRAAINLLHSSENCWMG